MTSRRSNAERAGLRIVPPAGAPRPRLPLPTLDDSELLVALRAGDAQAAASLHDRLRPVVERSVRRLLGAHDRDQEDLVQHSMIQICTTVERFRGDCPLDAWASAVAAHAVYNHIRRKTLERRYFEGYFGDDRTPAWAAHDSARGLSARSTLRQVFKHLDAIEPAKAWSFVLHDVCGYDLREVAEITESTVAASQSRLVRGRRELRERVAADPEIASLLNEDEEDET